jgi:hypothetical protein
MRSLSASNSEIVRVSFSAIIEHLFQSIPHFKIDNSFWRIQPAFRDQVRCFPAIIMMFGVYCLMFFV